MSTYINEEDKYHPSRNTLLLVIVFDMLALTILTSLFVSAAIAANSCRQCYGDLTIVYPAFVSLGTSNAYVKPVLAGCATGDEFDTTAVRHGNDCYDYATYTACKTWIYTLRVWRYCGNGAKAIKSRTKICDGGSFCASTSFLDLTCYKSVSCAGSCDKRVCL